MTDRITISVPDEVGAFLRGTGNASATVSDLVAQAMERQATVDLLTRAGYDVTPEFIEDGLRLIAETPNVPPEVVARAAAHRQARLEESKQRRIARGANSATSTA